jgi:undecaprenyl-diphosphatase
VTGLAAIGINSAVVNLPMKFATKRARPERQTAGVPVERWVPMPTSTSFPSGHSASAFAFAEAVTASIPSLSVPLRLLAGAVAYSRVHTGVHYPGDVVVGSLVGATIGEATSISARALLLRRDERRRSRSRPPDDRRRTPARLRSPR